MSKQETVEVTLKLPKPVYEFYKAYATYKKTENVESFIVQEIILNADGIIDDISRGFIVKQFGLEGYSSIPVEDCEK